jgi:xanthine/uracil permease
VTRPERSDADEGPDLNLREEAALADGSLAGLAFTGAVLGLALLFFVRSFSINSDAEIWPKVISGLLVLLAGLQLLRSLAARAGSAAEQHDPGAADRVWRRAFTAAWLIAFAVVAKFTGFGVATLLFVPVYLVASGIRSPLWIVVITAFSAAALTVLFGEFAGVPIWGGRF